MILSRRKSFHDECPKDTIYNDGNAHLYNDITMQA
jgi:hypothetical protein